MNYETLTYKLSKGSNKTLFYVSVVPVNSLGQVLLGERKSDGIWTTPGGGAELNESPEQAAIREAFEESGLRIAPHTLNLIGVKAAPDGKPVHCYMVQTDQNNFTVKMDPDREVSEWKWYSREQLPEGLSRQKNANRLETIGQALMKFYGLRKNMNEDSNVLSLIEKLNKGGPGSGIQGHQTPKKEFGGAKNNPTQPYDEVTNIERKNRNRGEEVGDDKNRKVKPYTTSGSSMQQAHEKHEEKIQRQKNKKTIKVATPEEIAVMNEERKRMGLDKYKKSDVENLVNKLIKGGIGSGIRGHHTEKDRGMIRNKKTNKTIPTEQFYAETSHGLMNYSGFDSKPGHFMNIRQVAAAVTKETGWEGQIALDIAKELEQRGKIQRLGKIFAVMKKSETSDIEKGGIGSGIEGHRTARDRLNAKLKARGIPKEKWHLYTDRHVQRETSIGRDALGNDLRPGEEKHRAYAGQPQTRDSIAQRKRKEELEKASKFEEVKHPRARGGVFTTSGGGSSSSSSSNTPEKPSLKSHLLALEQGKVMPNLKTNSGKPVTNDMDVARAHGYSVQDHVDAMNEHYKLAQITREKVDKLKMAGHDVPPEGEKIVKFHAKKMKEHMNARQRLEERKKQTEASIKGKKTESVRSVKKAVTQMGSGLGDRDLDIGSFAQASAQGSPQWMERLYTGMDGADFGDTPREFECDKGMLYLSKVDDGIYSGFFTRNDEGLLDNAKVRIERMTIPELVQFMVAKEWINNPVVALPVDTLPEAVAPSQPDFLKLNDKLQAPDSLDQKIRLLDLVSKLIG